MGLVLCAACRRHVRSSEASCPFCSAPREATLAIDAPAPRLSRAASFLLPVLLGAGSVACSASQPSPGIAATHEGKPSPSASVSAAPSPSVSASASSAPSAYPSGTIAIYGSPSIVILDRVFFDVGSTVVGKDAEPILQAIAEILATKPKWHLAIDARAETSEGKDASARLALSKKRGEAIAAKLVAFGVDAKRLRVEPRGDTQPISGDKTKEGRAHNRSASFRAVLEDGTTPTE